MALRNTVQHDGGMELRESAEALGLSLREVQEAEKSALRKLRIAAERGAIELPTEYSEYVWPETLEW